MTTTLVRTSAVMLEMTCVDLRPSPNPVAAPNPHPQAAPHPQATPHPKVKAVVAAPVVATERHKLRQRLKLTKVALPLPRKPVAQAGIKLHALFSSFCSDIFKFIDKN